MYCKSLLRHTKTELYYFLRILVLPVHVQPSFYSYCFLLLFCPLSDLVHKVPSLLGIVIFSDTVSLMSQSVLLATHSTSSLPSGGGGGGGGGGGVPSLSNDEVVRPRQQLLLI